MWTEMGDGYTGPIKLGIAYAPVAPIKTSSAAAVIPGSASGTWTRKNVCQKFAPSVREAASTSRGYRPDDPWVGGYYGTRWVDQPANRHSQGANVAFLDSHVEYFRWKAAKRFLSYAQLATGADLQDLRRMQSCIPKPKPSP